MSKINKFRKPTVAILTALLIISIAMPLLSLATAAGTSFSLVTTSGPNGTTVQVSGTGFTPSLNQLTGTPFTVTIDGSTVKAVTSTTASPVVFTSTNCLQTDANGVLSGYFVIKDLTVGTHTNIIISDGSHSVQSNNGFTVTRPTVALSTASGAVGTSQLVTGSGFPTGVLGGPTITNVVTAGSYPTGTPLAGISTTGTTTSATDLSSRSISTMFGTFKATVTPRGYITATSDNTFSLTDTFGNVASTAFTPAGASVTLSATSGPVGTTVVATLTGFGPGATVQTYSAPNPSGIWIGNGVSPTSLTISSVTVNQQGSAQVPITITGTGVDFCAGAKTITVVDTFGNLASATFTITPKVTIEMGDGTASSGTTFVPSTAGTTGVYLQVSGFAPNAKLTFTRSPSVPIQWTTFASDAAITTTSGGVLTAAVWSSTAAAPGAGTYSITVSDGTNTASATLITVSALPYMAITPTSGPGGSYISIKTYAAANTAATAMTFDGSAVTPGTYPTSIVWPATGGVTGLLTLPAATTGAHTLAVSAGGASGATAVFTVTNAATVTAFPASVVIGQSVPLSGTGYKTSAAGITPTITIDSVTVSAGTLAISATGVLSGAFTMPTFLPGPHTIVISDGSTTATTTITVLAASISIASASGTLTTTTPFGTEAATTLALTGSGFKAGEGISMVMEDYPGHTVTLTAGTAVGLTVVNPSGDMLLNSGFELPANVIAGTHTITVTGTTSGAAATFTFTVTPKVLTSTSAIRAGQNLGISASGFAASVGLTLSLNGTQATWYDLSASPVTAMTTPVSTTSAGSLASASSRGTVIASTLSAGSLTVTLTDSLGNTASKTITILAAPAITLSATNLVAGAQGGTATTASTYINGTGFTPGAGRTISVKILSGSTTVATLNPTTSLLSGTVSVGSTGRFSFTTGTTTPVETFVVPSNVPAGEYTLQVTIGTTAAPPVETATATITVMSSPIVTAPTTAAALQNVTITVTGLTTISTVSLGSATLVAAGVPNTCTVVTPNVPYFGPVTIPTTGANANTLTTWMIVPETLMAGSYTLTVTDTPAGLTATVPITVTPGLVISSVAVKGDAGTIAGYGFAPNSIVTAKINGAALPEAAGATISTDGSGKFTGASVYTFNVPASAIVNNTITVTDASGNTATKYLTVTAPTLNVNPTSAAAGSTVQLIGSGYKVNSAIFVQVGGNVVATTPISVTATGGSFVCYITIPATTAQGSTIIVATDTSNNQGIANFNVTNGQSSTGVTVNTTTMSSTAQTTNGAGQTTTTFTQGSTVTASFNLVSGNGASGDVVCKVTWQQGAKVYNMAISPAAISPTAKTVSFSNLIPAGATGTWTATLQVYAADGTTPLGVTILTFTVS